MSRRTLLTPGIVVIIRHRAVNYAAALREQKPGSERVAHEMRALLHDMLGADEVMELTDAWLARHRARQERRVKEKV